MGLSSICIISFDGVLSLVAIYLLDLLDAMNVRVIWLVEFCKV